MKKNALIGVVLFLSLALGVGFSLYKNLNRKIEHHTSYQLKQILPQKFSTTCEWLTGYDLWSNKLHSLSDRPEESYSSYYNAVMFSGSIYEYEGVMYTSKKDSIIYVIDWKGAEHFREIESILSKYGAEIWVDENHKPVLQ